VSLTLAEGQDGIPWSQPLHEEGVRSNLLLHSLQLKVETMKRHHFRVVMRLLINDEALSHSTAAEVTEERHVSSTLQRVVVVGKQLDNPRLGQNVHGANVIQAVHSVAGCICGL